MNGWDIWATIGAWVQATKSGESSRSGREHGRHMWVEAFGNTVFIVVGACSDKSERSSIKRAKTQSVKEILQLAAMYLTHTHA